MAVSLLKRLAASGPAPTYVLALGDRRRLVSRLRLEGSIDLVRSPRHASVLLVASRLPESMHSAARLVHDQMPHPRTVVSLADNSHVFPSATVASPGDAARVACEVHESLQLGKRGSSKPLMPTQNPVEWQGVGPHGQGGKGMMGGKPYGRKMAMTGEDVRDGLELDQVSATLGPFLPWMPPGLELAVVLQGDLVQQATPRVPHDLPSTLPDIFWRARHEPVDLAKLELARARHHLEACAEMLQLHGLDALARRAYRVADTLEPGRDRPINKLAKSLRWSGALRLGLRGVGELRPEQVRGLGFLARACGEREDARLADPAYVELGFGPMTRGEGDALARFRLRLDEAAQSIALAGRAMERAKGHTRQPGPAVEGLHGSLDTATGPRLRQLICQIAPGMPWDEFVATLVSFDVDPAAFPPSRDYGDSRVGCHVEDEDDGGHGGHHHHHHHDR